MKYACRSERVSHTESHEQLFRSGKWTGKFLCVEGRSTHLRRKLRFTMPGHFKQLSVWKKSIDLADFTYSATTSFPKHEVYGLASQMRRAAVSIASNIAEGQAHHSHRDFIRFLRLARGSVAEPQTQTVIAGRRKYVSREIVSQLWKDADEVSRMMHGLIVAAQKQLTDSAPSDEKED